MITSSMIMFAQAFISVMCYSNKSAIKLSVSLFLLSTFLFYEFSHTTSSVMMPMILYLMFMGGILMTFMIISAITPSAKMSKAKKMASFTLAGGTITILLVQRTPMFNLKMSQEMFLYKTIMVQLPLMMMMVLILLIYFFSMMSMISSSKANLRTLMWCC